MGLTKKQMKEYDATISRFCEETTNKDLTYSQIQEIADKLHRYEITLSRINETRCNVEMTTKQEDKMERHEESIEKKVAELIFKLGFTAEFNYDPSGAAIKIKLPSGQFNSWDGKSWVIAW